MRSRRWRCGRSLIASDALLEDLLHLKRFVFAVYRLASQHRATLEAFLRPDFPLVGGDVIEPYFRDLDERLGRLLDALEAAKESVNGSFDLYVSQVAHRTNDIMKVLTIVSVTLLPASVILGLLRHQLRVPAAWHDRRVHHHGCPDRDDHGGCPCTVQAPGLDRRSDDVRALKTSLHPSAIGMGDLSCWFAPLSFWREISR